MVASPLGVAVLQELIGHFTYAAIAGLLIAGGLGIPVPEELVQLTAGYLARRGILSFAPALAVTWMALVTGDFLLFRLGRRHGPKVLDSRHLSHILTPERRAFIDRHFARHAVLTIMVARHASGLRLPVFALAGATGVRSRTFLLADGVSALLSVPLVVSVGWLFAGQMQRVKRGLHAVEFVLAALALAFFVAWVLVARRREQRSFRPPADPRP